jgi:D-ribose pyranase
MKKGKVLNNEISHVISTLGHTDTIVIGDCGLPIPDHVKRIDLALTLGVPSFLETLSVVLSEQFIEKITIANELKEKNIQVYSQMMKIIKATEKEQENLIEVIEVSHEVFKKKTEQSKAIVRTGETTPYSNIILHSGVVF